MMCYKGEGKQPWSIKEDMMNRKKQVVSIEDSLSSIKIGIYALLK